MYSNPIAIARGLATYIPGLSQLELALRNRKFGTVSARYCYAVWLRHLTLAGENGLSTHPQVVAELGPGASLGIGLAALLSGAGRYYAFDVVKYVRQTRNLEILDELVALFQKREPIPGESEFPYLKPGLPAYHFPAHILTETRLGEALNPSRLAAIREAVRYIGHKQPHNIQISYFAPWFDPQVLQEQSVDMIYSQAVLEHVDDLAYTYEMMYRWLKPGGFMSHQIDFKSHNTARAWNGHWAYSDFMWKLIRGKRAYLLNRQSYGAHLELCQRFDFEVMCDLKIKNASPVPRKALAPRFKNMSDNDLTTSGTFIQARKR